MIQKLFKNIPFERVYWTNSIFLTVTLIIALTATPWYIYTYGLDMFQVILFFAFYFATGISITLGYHRLFSHLAFKAKWPVKLFTLVFGAAAFENAALDWCSDHRRHHKHVDGHLDPYDITQGFWWAHIGWLLFKLHPEPPMDNVADLRKDKLVMWQHKYILPLAIGVGFGLPTLIGYLYGGPVCALGAFLIGGVARVVAVQQSTFCINSLCHTIGDQPYSSKCSARDSWVAALASFGEGYHNYHHEFQHDYRNAIKPWQFDPTKWIVWTLSKVGLTSNLRRVPDSKILLVQLQEAQRRIDQGLEALPPTFPETASKIAHESFEKLQELSQSFTKSIEELQESVKSKADISKNMMKMHKKEIESAIDTLNQLTRSATS